VLDSIDKNVNLYFPHQIDQNPKRTGSRVMMNYTCATFRYLGKGRDLLYFSKEIKGSVTQGFWYINYSSRNGDMHCVLLSLDFYTLKTLVMELSISIEKDSYPSVGMSMGICQCGSPQFFPHGDGVECSPVSTLGTGTGIGEVGLADSPTPTKIL